MSNITKENALRANNTKIKWNFSKPIRGYTPVKIEHFEEIDNTLTTIETALTSSHAKDPGAHGTVTTQKAGFLRPDQVKSINNLLMDIRYLLIELENIVSPTNMIVANEKKFTATTVPSGWELCDSSINNKEQDFSNLEIMCTSIDCMHQDNYLYSQATGTTFKTERTPVTYLKKKDSTGN